MEDQAQEIQVSSKKHAELADQLQQSLGEIQRLKSTISQLNSQLALRQQQQQNSSQLQEQEQACQSLRQDNKVLRNLLTEKGQQCAELSAELGNREIAEVKLQRKAEELQKQLELAGAERASLVARYEEALRDRDRQVDQLKLQFESRRKDIEELRDSLSVLREGLSSVNTDEQRFSAQARECNPAAQERRPEWLPANVQLKAENNRLCAELSMKSDELFRLEKSVREMQCEAKHLET